MPRVHLTVNGGVIAIGGPHGMSGSGRVEHALAEGRRRGARYGAVTMCVGAAWVPPARYRPADGRALD
jgi:acetyl-CoA C-acetyltransferase